MRHPEIIYLVFSSLIITAIGLSYGLIPLYTMKALYGISITDNNLIYILRAVMGLYLAHAFFWLISAARGELGHALQSQSIFLTGLILGRFLSVYMEGFPSFILLFYRFGEILFFMANRIFYFRIRSYNL